MSYKSTAGYPLFMTQAKAHAKQRWLWEDDSFIEEMYDERPPAARQSAASWIDELAEKYDLTDPRSVGL